MRTSALPVLLALVACGLSGCDAVFGSKSDPTTDEIFVEGQTDPTLVDDVGYVPLNPFYTEGFGGAFQSPVDVYVGYDEFVYVADERGLHVLDLAGRPQFLLSEVEGQPLRDITAIVQDRRLDVYVAARRDTTVAGADCPSAGGPEQCDLAVVYRIRGLTTGAPRVADILWHPFDDGSRRFTRFELPDTYAGATSDEDVEFTGVATLADNRLYVTRRGPVNTTATGRPSQAFSPFNAFLQYTAEGEYIQYVRALTPDRPSLLSAYYPSDVLTFVGPPQRGSVALNEDFVLALAPPPSEPTPTYGVVSVQVVETSDGIEYRVDSGRLGAAGNPDLGDGALFEAGQFVRPTSLAYAADQTGYLFVLDAGTDSLYVFNQNGIEGVAPPPGAGSTRPVRASFGGTGAGPLQFSDPQGVAYYREVVYVADTGNHRVSRFRLNTDFE
ncbi:hypothetical protein [Rubrivirga sp.]|uniref:hypothetical protein n=1 Tax=Rubrivirga sp. TaxID=1885344 RepID=UPI003B5170A9